MPVCVLLESTVHYLHFVYVNIRCGHECVSILPHMFLGGAYTFVFKRSGLFLKKNLDIRSKNKTIFFFLDRGVNGFDLMKIAKVC